MAMGGLQWGFGLRQQTQLEGRRNGTGAIGNLKASHHFTEVIAHGVGCDVEPLANFAIAESFRHPAQNFVLSFRKRLAICWLQGSTEVFKSWIEVSFPPMKGFERFDQSPRALLKTGCVKAGIGMQLSCQSQAACAVLVEDHDAAMIGIQAFDLSEEIEARAIL